MSRLEAFDTALLAIVRRLREASRSDPSPIGAFQVCVGIASEPAFVGTIRSADRRNWTALGHRVGAAPVRPLVPSGG